MAEKQNGNNEAFEQAVALEVAKQMAAYQQSFAAILENAVKSALEGVDNANAALSKERESVAEELTAVQDLRKKASDGADEMAAAYFKDRVVQFNEAAQTRLLRDLALHHFQQGKSIKQIAQWLQVSVDFLKDIQAFFQRQQTRSAGPPRSVFPEGNPRLTYQDEGRGGTVWYENLETKFSMWWEFAGGSALVILDIPTEKKWKDTTKLPPEQRNTVLTFIAEQIVADKIGGDGHFIIGENVITFYGGGY